MKLLLAFAPFIAFAVLDRTIGAREGLISGAIVSAALVIREVVRSRPPKVLEVGTLILFGGLTICTLSANPEWSVVGVRLCVDIGLLVIVLVSLAIRRPFTLLHARERVSPQHWSSPVFVRTNYVITAVWALAFAVLVATEVIVLYVPEVPHQVGVIATIAALAGAFKFTDWYPNRTRDGSSPHRAVTDHGLCGPKVGEVLSPFPRQERDFSLTWTPKSQGRLRPGHSKP